MSGPAALLGTGDNVKAVVVEDLTEDSKVIGAIVGSRHVTNVVKTLQQVTSRVLILDLQGNLKC